MSRDDSSYALISKVGFQPNRFQLEPCVPGHELLKLGAGEIEAGPVCVSHRFVLGWPQIGQQGGHLVKRPSSHCLVIPK